MRFSREDFDQMVHEVLFTKPSRFDALCHIAQQVLPPFVKSWCNAEPDIRGRGFEEDVMQGILLHLMKTVVHGFLLNKRAADGYNDNPEGFEHWITKVAHNFTRDYIKEVRRVEFRAEPEEALERLSVSDEDWAERQEQQNTLRQAFHIVLASDTGVYKVLTWLAQVLFVVDKGLAHHKANALIVRIFENKTLGEMYDFILAHSQRVPWMTVSPQQHRRILAALRKPYDDEFTYGEMQFKDFFMLYKGEISGKKSVSDWIYRVNQLIRRKTERDTSSGKSAPSKSGKKRRDEDESSDVG